jgi:hypothetical protein
MKKILSAILAGVCMMLVAATSHANVFTFDQPSLLNFSQIDGNSNFVFRKFAVGTETEFHAYLDPETPTILIGLNTQSNPLDLTGFSQYGLFFHDVNNSLWNINLYIASGSGENLKECESSSLALFPDDNKYGLYPVSGSLFMNLQDSNVNLSDVTKIGFRITGNFIGPDANLNPGDGGDLTEIRVSPVPEPASMMLLGSGFLGLLGFVRRKRS